MKKLTIGWLYPELMNVYGDRGNVICLTKRCLWRDIKVEIKHLEVGFNEKELSSCNLLLMGGAQDRQQDIVIKDLRTKNKTITKMADDGVPGLFICGGYQFLGNFYRDVDNNITDGLGIFNMHTENMGDKKPRLIGNVAIRPYIQNVNKPIIGFENHGGRTYLSDSQNAFGRIIKGYGNCDNGLEGSIYNNFIGTYLHGPIMPKNPHLADHILAQALNMDKLRELDDEIESKAYSGIAKSLHVEI